MKRIILLGIALAFAASSASGADLALKARPANPFLTPTVSGWYIGVGTEAAVAQANVSGTNLFATSLVGGDLKAAGGAVGGDVGYIGVTASGWRVRLETGLMYQNITGSSADGGSIVSRWSATQEVDTDFSMFQKISSAIGNLGINFPSFNPVLPSNVAVGATPWQYIGIGAREFGLSGNFFGAQGSSWSVSPMIKSGFMWQTLDATGKPNGGALDAYAWVSFPQHGLTLNNVLGAGGAPMISGAAQMGTQYGLGLKYDFGI